MFKGVDKNTFVEKQVTFLVEEERAMCTVIGGSQFVWWWLRLRGELKICMDLTKGVVVPGQVRLEDLCVGRDRVLEGLDLQGGEVVVLVNLNMV